MKKYWLVATYKSKDINRIENNLTNQQFSYYLPKIIIKTLNSSPREVALFPGYIFINTYLEKYSELKFTRGIKEIIRFGENIPRISDNEIKSMKIIEEKSQLDPINTEIQLGQDAFVSKGSFKGLMGKICSLPAKRRVEILLYFLGSNRKINLPQENLEF